MGREPILEVNNLTKEFEQSNNFIDVLLNRDEDPIRAVDDVNIVVEENDSIGVIGESGCGKTTLIMTLMGLYSPTDGEILFNGESTAEFDKADWKNYRENTQMIFQDPFNSIDPKLTVREWLLEPLKIHGIGDRERRVREELERVELRPPEGYIDKLPKQLSGGEKQRVSIARALISEPEVILADEPVSMLDVSTQAAILRLLSRLVDETGVSLIYISHDLSTVSYVCQDINVMYLGRIIEWAPTADLISDPKHPYTSALVNAIPIPDPYHDRPRTDIEGVPQEPVGLDEGCRFRDRCPERMDICEKNPESIALENGREVACHLYYDHEEYMNNRQVEPKVVENE